MSAAASFSTGVLMMGTSSRSGRLPPAGHTKDLAETGLPSDGKEIFRLASGIFYDLPPLGRAIAELLAGGFRRREMCLAGTREALGNATVLPAQPRQLRPLYPLTPNIEVMATSGTLLRRLLKEAAWRMGESNLTSAWLLPELFGRFTDHIRQNAIVLLVSAPDPALQHQGSRILLRHSAHTVQTHEFSAAHLVGV